MLPLVSRKVHCVGNKGAAVLKSERIVAFFARLREIAGSHGTVSVAKIIGWDGGLQRPFAQLRDLGFELIEVPGTGKNSADIGLAIEATRDLVADERLTHLVVASGDNDFTPLAVAAKKMGCRVIGLLPVAKTGQYWTRVLDHTHMVASPVVAPRQVPRLPKDGGRVVSSTCACSAESQPAHGHLTFSGGRLVHVLPWALREAFAKTIRRISAREGVVELPSSLLPRVLQSVKDSVACKGIKMPSADVMLRGCLDLVGVSIDAEGNQRLHLTPEGLLSLGITDTESFR